MQDSIFREYDIRGKVGSELILSEVGKLGAAIAYFLYEKQSSIKTVLVGMDGRTTSPEMKDSLCAALQDAGLDIVFVGVAPSPVVYFGLYTMPVDACLVVTASHNPPEYNGIKMMLNKKLIDGKQIRYIGDLYKQGKKVSGKSRGALSTYDLNSNYIKWMVEKFPTLKNKTIGAAIDAGNGTGGAIMPAMTAAFGWKDVELLCMKVQGVPEKHEADPVVEKNMICVQNALKQDRYTLGIGLDGDCDRMAAMTKEGKVVIGDRLLSIFAQPILRDNPGAAIVFDIKCSSGLPELIQKWGGKPVMSPSGHTIIKKYMAESSALLGGELSCHFFFHDHYFGFDDGIYAMLRLFEILATTGKTLDELVSVFPPKVDSPEFRIACTDDKKQKVIEAVKKYFSGRSDVSIHHFRMVRVAWPYGWGIVRASNTQPVLSIRFEADTAQNLAKVKQEFIKAMQPWYDADQLVVEFSKD